MSDNRAVPTVQLENEHLRVTEWRFAPGAATGWHRHPHDYVVVPVGDGELELVGQAGVEHDVINAGAEIMTFVEVELKDTGG